MRQTFILLLTAGVVLAGCNRSQNSSATSPNAAQSQPKITVDPSYAGSISGTVHFIGAAPAPIKVDMSFDPACAMSPRGENVVSPVAAKDGKLANVFVYVKSAPFLADWATPREHVIVDQNGCRYEPHVVGAMAGQTMEFRNSDSTDHNVHAAPKINPEWNQSQTPKSPPILKQFDMPEIMVPVKCNQHPWMKMYVNVVASPLFAVTDANGNFEIKGLPPGDYTLAAGQERFGERTITVKVAPHERKNNVDFSFQ